MACLRWFWILVALRVKKVGKPVIWGEIPCCLGDCYQSLEQIGYLHIHGGRQQFS
jgi:hypothetical protein